MVGFAVRTRRLAEVIRDERGAAMSEYGLLIALVFIVAIASVGLYGEAVVGLFTEVNDEYLRNAVFNATPATP